MGGGPVMWELSCSNMWDRSRRPACVLLDQDGQWTMAGDARRFLDDCVVRRLYRTRDTQLASEQQRRMHRGVWGVILM